MADQLSGADGLLVAMVNLAIHDAAVGRGQHAYSGAVFVIAAGIAERAYATGRLTPERVAAILREGAPEAGKRR